MKTGWGKIRRNVSPLLAGLVCVYLLTGCGIRQTLPDYKTPRNCYPITVGDGPEDFVLDRWDPTLRLLISCHERRGPERYGGIWSYNIPTGYVEKMKREGEPETLASFQPHGMDIRHTAGNTYLYVILHDINFRSNRFENGIAIYQVRGNTLHFQDLLVDSGKLWSPNDLSVLQNGDIYVTNDYRSTWDVYLRKKNSQVVFYSVADKRWVVAAEELSFANGILALPDKVYVSATRSDKLLEYDRNSDGTLRLNRVLARIKGLDNIMPFGGRLIVTAHFDDLAFYRHHKDETIPSPSVVFDIDPNDPDPDQSKTVLYVDDGHQISAASTAFVYGGRLYISQVFGKKILVCDAGDLTEAGHP